MQFQDSHNFNIYEDPMEDRLQHSPIAQNEAKSTKVTDRVQLFDTGTTQQLLNITKTL